MSTANKYRGAQAKQAAPKAVAAPHDRVSGRSAAAVSPPSYGIDFVDCAAAAERAPDQLDGVLQRMPLGGASGVARGARSASEAAGLPNRLKADIEARSGLDMSDVRVHANSAEPRRLGALAFARGNDIHLAPGQEQHLPHEAWHVVQQKQGRVRANLQIAGVRLNHEDALEEEADRIGAQSIATQPLPGRTLRADVPNSAAPVAQALFGVEVEANIPVYKATWPNPTTNSTDPAEVLAFFAGTNDSKGVYLHQGTAGSKKPYSITIDKGGPTETCIKDLLKDWAGKATSNKQQLSTIKPKPKKAEYVTEPYSERYLSAGDTHRRPGLFDFFRDFEILQTHIENDLGNARNGVHTVTPSGAYGAPSLAAWQAAAQHFGLPQHATEAQTAFSNVATAVTDDLYVQSTLGVLPEAVASLYAQEQKTASDQFPLSRGAVDWTSATSARSEDEAILGAMEVSALDTARKMAAKLQLQQALDREAFAGYMATILIEMGGEAIIQGGKKSGGVLKNVSSLLSKTNLVTYRRQLPEAVRGKIADTQIRDHLATESINWMKGIVTASNKMLAQSQHDRKDIAANEKILKQIAVPDKGIAPSEDDWADEPAPEDFAEGYGISYLRFENRIREILKGARDRLYDAQLDKQGSGLEPEDPLKGAATGKYDLDTGGTRSRAIPFEVRGPHVSNRMKSTALADYAQKVITRLRAANDPLDDQSPQREAILAAPLRAKEALGAAKAADDYAIKIKLWAADKYEASKIDESSAVVLGQGLGNVVGEYRKLLTPAEQADFDLLVGARYGGDYSKYLAAKQVGKIPFLAFQEEFSWIKGQYTTVTSEVRDLAAPQPYLAAATEVPLARHAAHLALTIKAHAEKRYLGLPSVKQTLFWTEIGKRYAGGFDSYANQQAMKLDFKLDVAQQIITLQQKEIQAIDAIRV